MISRKSTTFLRRVYGILLGLGTVGAGIAYLEVIKFKKRLQIPVVITHLEKEKEDSYIYIRNHSFWKPESETVYKTIYSAIGKSRKHYDKLMGIKHEFNFMSTWDILRLLQNKDKNIKQATINKISEYHRWHDFEYNLLSERLDADTLITLAMTKDVDKRFFKPPPLIHLVNEDDIEDELRELLVKLPQEDVDDTCLRYFTQEALSISDERKMKRGGKWCFGGNGINYTREVVPQEKVELYCVQALVKHSKVPHHCKVMVDNGILSLLQQIRKLRKNNSQIQSNIVRVVANIAMYEEFHRMIINSGWITIFSELMNSDQLPLRMQATRALLNLTEESVKGVYEDGVYVLHPRHCTREEPDADIVFVHGLMGGAFHSWRQQEIHSNPTTRDFTYCWPEKWLPRDIPNARILCVEYDTQLSDWLAKCPHNQHRQTLSYRSREILDKLNKANVGNGRPIIWIAHSMGGLIVKQMLSDASKMVEYKNFENNTRGILFYSTPHFGSDLAKYSLKTRILLYPSVEVMELASDSAKLNTLNDEFKNIALKNKYNVLSFGEIKETKIALNVQQMIVSENSSNPGIGEHLLVDVNHLNICKPPTSESEIYIKTVSFCKTSLISQEIKEIINEIADCNPHLSNIFS